MRLCGASHFVPRETIKDRSGDKWHRRRKSGAALTGMLISSAQLESSGPLIACTKLCEIGAVESAGAAGVYVVLQPTCGARAMTRQGGRGHGTRYLKTGVARKRPPGSEGV